MWKFVKHAAKGSEVLTLTEFTVKYSQAPVAQLDRASAFGAEGWEFESLRAHQIFFASANALECAAATAAETAAGESSTAAEAATTAPSRSRRTGPRRRHEYLMHIRRHAMH
jgi:hypothetical protein